MERRRRIEGGLTLEAKVAIAKVVIGDALSRFARPFVVWSGGKDSTVVLHLVREEVTRRGISMPPALFIDHGMHFDETLDFVDKVSREWGFRVVYARNEDALSKVRDGKICLDELDGENRREAREVGFEGGCFDYSLESVVGNHLLKTVAMKRAVRKHRIDALFLGIRWDENPARSWEVFISPRGDPPHVRVHPILTFTERNVWDYTLGNGLPVHPLYAKGYRSLDGKQDSRKVDDRPAWEQDLEGTPERLGRAQDKEGFMETLRRYGYM
ncbi:MAG: phosphoadenosine phosphosulfate reductase family protein [Conexivisphaera sp.]